MTKPIHSASLPSILALVLAFTAACSGDAPPEAAHPSDSARITLASTDLSVGENRVVFALIRPGIGSVKDARVEAQTFFLASDGSRNPAQTAPAIFRTWPGGTGGVYQTNLSFDRPGEWGLGVVATLPDGTDVNAGARIDVKETSSTPAVGSPAPRSRSKTASASSQLPDITTDPNPDPDLYRLTIAQALDESIPLLVTFATPAYCRTATCGPQMNVVKELKDIYADRMNFIHVEVYDNPAEIRERGISAARIAPALTEWGLPSEPWTFLVDGGGIIRAKYEGFVGADELETPISDLIS